MAGSIIIDLLMRTGSFETDSKRAERRLNAFKREAAQVGKVVGAAFVAAGAAVTATLVGMIQRGREVIDSQAKMAQQFRTTFESIETLSRAGELAGLSLEQITTAGRTLEVNLAKGTQGIGAQARALEALGINAEELVGIPLDQKIARVNDALARNVDASERAAVAADLFGSRNGQAIALLSPETIAEAARQTAIFGTNLSDVDAAQVELANDALGTFSLAAKGVQNQLTVQFAPILQGIGDEFLTWAENAGGFEQIVTRVFDRTVKGAGFVADAIGGIGRLVDVVADALVIGFAAVEQTFSRFGRLGADILSLIPGIDFSEQAAAFERNAVKAEGVVRGAWSNIQATLLEPLPSEAFDQWVADARAASQETAEAIVAARDAANAPTPAAAATRRMTIADVALPDTAFDTILEDLDQTIEGFKRAGQIVAGTRTQVERLEEQIAEVRELAAAGFFAGGADQEVLARLEADLEAARAREAERAKGDIDDLTEFATQASRNAQDIIAQNLRDGFAGGARGILDQFTNLISDLVAQALAADLGKRLFGEGLGSGGGLIGAAGGFLGSVFGGGRAFGGGVNAGVTYGINELEPEFFTPATSGMVVPLSKMRGAGGGGVNVTQNIQVAGRVDQRTAAQLAIEASRRQRVASARLG